MVYTKDGFRVWLEPGAEELEALEEDDEAEEVEFDD